jgi:hypothetical protein
VPRPYDTDTQDGWRDAVDRWEWQKLGPRAWRKVLDCPRCDHPMTVDYTIAIVANLLPTLRRRAAAHGVVARCNCSIDHPGHPPHPEDGWGCGQAALIAPPGLE